MEFKGYTRTVVPQQVDCKGAPVAIAPGNSDPSDHLRSPRETSLGTLIDSLQELVAHLDHFYQVRFLNRACRDWFGLEPEAQVGRTIAEVIGDEAFAVLKPCFDQALAGEATRFCGDVPYRLGRPRFIHGTYLPSRDQNGEVDGLYLLSVDLTDHNVLRRRLATETTRARTVLRNAIDGIITIDDSGRIQSLNPAAERIFGYSAAEAVGRDVSLLMTAYQGADHKEYVRRYLDTGEARIIGMRRELVGQHRDGSTIDIELAVAEFLDGGRRYFTGFIRDVTDRKRAEALARERLDELAHVARQHSMGELATGLAHEVNQPLTAIHANAEACLAMVDAAGTGQEPLRGALREIVQQSGRASRIVDGLRHFLQVGSNESWTLENPNELVEEMLDLLAHEIHRSRVRVELDLAADVPMVHVDRTQIEQVIFNLVKNAVDALAAMPGERVLAACTRVASASALACRIEIADTGPGVGAEQMRRLFEPFFTTKIDGLGQGLRIARSIVEDHGGELLAENRDTGGMRFSILLPATTDATTDE